MFFGMTQAQFDALEPHIKIFLSLAHGFHNSVPIVRASASDKEYHFQNWVKRRIQATGLQYKELGRNGYPDFVLKDHPSGFEVKGLSHPGRSADFDCNSQIPLAEHDGRKIYYIFGRYPSSKENEFSVHDLVLCSAALLNAETVNKNTNQSFRGAGSYGDILIRDRRMYVCATPYALEPSTAGTATLIVEPSEHQVPNILSLTKVLNRVQAQETVTGYSFDLQSNKLTSQKGANLAAGRVHEFKAYQLRTERHEPEGANQGS